MIRLLDMYSRKQEQLSKEEKSELIKKVKNSWVIHTFLFFCFVFITLNFIIIYFIIHGLLLLFKITILFVSIGEIPRLDSHA